MEVYYILISIILTVCLTGCFVIKVFNSPGTRSYFPVNYKGYYCIILSHSYPLPEKDSDGFYVLKFDNTGVVKTGWLPGKGARNEYYYYDNEKTYRLNGDAFILGFGSFVYGDHRALNIGALYEKNIKIDDEKVKQAKSIEERARLFCPLWNG